jgi:hypothetical protein
MKILDRLLNCFDKDARTLIQGLYRIDTVNSLPFM